MRERSRKTAIQVSRASCIVILLLIGYVALIIPFSAYMHNKPVVEKLGHLPRAEVLQLLAGDQKQLVGESLILKVLIYFGGLMEQNEVTVQLPPDYMAMSRLLHAAAKLDPYNMDTYYFAQSILVWDVGEIKVANDLLEYGMKYRAWDWYLPFFAGFNYAYFQKDYAQAAKYYRLAGDLSGNALFVTLAGRYMHEAGETELALSYLSAMEKSATNAAIKKTYRIRLHALQAVRSIESARDTYRLNHGRLPASVEELAAAGYLKKIPVDPYGGQFYLAPDGKVKTTSNFAFVKK